MQFHLPLAPTVVVWSTLQTTQQPRTRKAMARYKKPDAIMPMMPIAGPRSIAHRIQPAWRVVKNMARLRHDELASHTGVAALRNLADDTMPEDQQKVIEAGAIEAVIAAMQAHPNYAGIQVAGSGTLVILANIDSAARKRSVEAGAIFELAAAIKRLEINNEGDGEKFGKHIVHKANFARDCLLKVAGKPTDPRNKKHIQAAIDAGVDPELFKRKDEKTRQAEAEAANVKWEAAKKAEREAEDVTAEAKPWVSVPENVREVAALFPGQGTQKKGMADKLLSDPNAKALFVIASRILDYDLEKLIAEGPQEKLDQTLYSQPAIFVTSLAAMEKAKKDKPEMLMKMKTAAGFSLGEYSALVFGGALSFEDGLKVVKARAEAMDAAAKEATSGMASVSGVGDAQLEAFLEQAASEVGGGKKGYIANYMFPEGRTCSGDTEVLKAMCAKVSPAPVPPTDDADTRTLDEDGRCCIWRAAVPCTPAHALPPRRLPLHPSTAHPPHLLRPLPAQVTALGQGKNAKMLNVSGAFHTPYMASAQAKLSAVRHAPDSALPAVVMMAQGQRFDRRTQRPHAATAHSSHRHSPPSSPSAPDACRVHTPGVADPPTCIALCWPQVLDEANIEMPSIQVYSNVTGMPYESVDEIKSLLKRQLMEPVKWEQGIQHLVSQSHAAYMEPGPGKQLKAMMRRIDQPAWAKMITLD